MCSKTPKILNPDSRPFGELLFLGPQPPALGPIYLFTAPGPNYFFTATNDGITFSRPPTSKIKFSRPLVITIVCHVILYYFKQN